MKIGDIKKIPCLNLEQQEYYERLMPKQRKYCDYRVLGYGKKAAYIRAGYKASKASAQGAYVLEKTLPMLAEIIDVRTKVRQSKEVYKSDSPMAKQMEAAVIQKDANAILDTTQNANPEVATQIKFYRDIANGTVKSTREIEFVDKAGIKSYRKEIVDDVKARLLARKELDTILGINKPLEVDSVEIGDIQINIVDTSKKDREKDETPNNTVMENIDADDYSVDGEESKQKVKNSSDNGKPEEAFFKRTGSGVWQK